ncbi:MAG TPA: GAF domain-containing protein [Elusimicrobiales bacterium]|mgnify:CR=1 FL=1|nr:GAF domain-containing protein [Elusimicrobiales bacterium]
MPDTLDLLLKFSEDLALENPQDEDALWEYLVRKGAGLLSCHAASFFEADDAKRRLTFKKSIGPVGADLVGLCFGYQGVVGACAESRKPILINDAENSPFFTKKVDQGSGFKTRTVIAAPVIANGVLMGVVEFINSIAGAFTEEDFKVAAVLGALVGRDVYIRKLEATIKQLNLKGESTINNLSGGFIGSDLDGRVIFFNLKASEIFEVGQEYLNRPVVELFQLCPDVVGAIGDVLKQNKTVRRQEFTCAVNGKKKLIGYSSINIKGVDGKVIGAGVIFQDITDL